MMLAFSFKSTTSIRKSQLNLLYKAIPKKSSMGCKYFCNRTFNISKAVVHSFASSGFSDLKRRIKDLPLAVHFVAALK
jgi:hypothetical protein